MLCGNSEEGRTLDLLPEIETCLIPVLSHIIEIILYDGPDVGLHDGLFSRGEKVVSVGDESCCAESRTIALGASPGSSEGSDVNIEFWFSET